MDMCDNGVFNEDIELGLVDRFWIDDGELNGLLPQEIFDANDDWPVLLAKYQKSEKQVIKYKRVLI